MTNHERIRTMSLDELTEFIVSLTGLLNPSDCTGCPAYEKCKEKDNDEYTSCIDSVRDWLYYSDPHKAWELSNQCIIQHKSIDELAAFLGAIGHYIFDENNCQDCPAAKECRERDAENCEQAFRFWLEAEAEEDKGPETTSNENAKERLYLFMTRAVREQENLFLDIIEQYEKGEQPDPEDKDLFNMIIERYLGGCGCIYCGKSTVPDRSPEKDVCTYADCARGLAEYINRMED